MLVIVPKFSPSKAQFYLTAPLISLLFCEPSLKGELETKKRKLFSFSIHRLSNILFDFMPCFAIVRLPTKKIYDVFNFSILQKALHVTVL